jgi:hypothetical protein
MGRACRTLNIKGLSNVKHMYSNRGIFIFCCYREGGYIVNDRRLVLRTKDICKKRGGLNSWNNNCSVPFTTSWYTAGRNVSCILIIKSRMFNSLQTVLTCTYWVQIQYSTVHLLLYDNLGCVLRRLGRGWNCFRCTWPNFCSKRSHGQHHIDLESPWRDPSNEHVTTYCVTCFGWWNWAGSFEYLVISENNDVRWRRVHHIRHLR